MARRILLAALLAALSPAFVDAPVSPQACGECRTDEECEALCTEPCKAEEGYALRSDGMCVECRGDDKDPAGCN